MGVDARTDEHRLSRRHLALTLGESIKLSLFDLRLQEKLREQATRDPLTGLFNRRYLEDSLDRELHRARRRQSPLSVAMLDLDHFNDVFGRDAGDALLRALGNVLRTALRQSDFSCRYGGGEFVLVFPDSSLADTGKRVEEIRDLLRAADDALYAAKEGGRDRVVASQAGPDGSRVGTTRDANPIVVPADVCTLPAHPRFAPHAPM